MTLEGIRVLELSDRDDAAAYCGKLFARWGADVIRVEPPSAAHDAALEIYLHGGKQRLALDWRDAARREQLAALAAGADVLVTDASPRDVEALRLLELGDAARPTVRISITPFGLSGPYRDYEATAPTLLALGGYTHLMGDPGRTPLTMPGNYAYYSAATYAYIAALAQLFGATDLPALVGDGSRHPAPRSGERAGPEREAPLFSGSRQSSASPTTIEISVLETLASLHQGTDTMWTAGGVVRSRHGNRWENLCPTTLLPCADGWVGFNVLQNFWFPFAHMIGHGEFAEPDHPWATNEGRGLQQDEVEATIIAAFADWPKERVFREGQETWRVPIGQAVTMGEAFADPHLRARDFWRPLKGVAAHDGKPLVTPGTPFRFVGEPVPEERAPAEPRDPDAAPAPSRWPVASSAAEPPTQPPRATTGRPGTPRAPLAGVRVIDLTRIWSGPVATRILGDLGAEVIKIEAQGGRGAGQARNVPPSARPWNTQALFNKLNRNKQSVALDLKEQEGRDLFLRLVAESDVVIENFSARAMPSLGLGYEALRAANPSIVYLAMPAFGLAGPYRDYVGLGPSIEPTTGLTALMGYSDAEPRVTAKAVTDPAAGTVAAAAILTALTRRQRTGAGAFIELSQHECGIAVLGEHFIERQLSGEEPSRIGNAHAQFAPHGIYRCAGDDEWLALAVRSDDDWRALCALAGAGWERDARFLDAAGRREHWAALDAAVEAWTVTQQKRALMEALQGRGVAAGAVLSAPEWLSDPHLVARGYFAELEHAEAGRSQTDGLPLRVNGERDYDAWRAAPLLGEHNAPVLSGLIGLSADEVAGLFDRGVIADRPPDVPA